MEKSSGYGFLRSKFVSNVKFMIFAPYCRVSTCRISHWDMEYERLVFLTERTRKLMRSKPYSLIRRCTFIKFRVIFAAKKSV